MKTSKNAVNILDYVISYVNEVKKAALSRQVAQSAQKKRKQYDEATFMVIITSQLAIDMPPFSLLINKKRIATINMYHHNR